MTEDDTQAAWYQLEGEERRRMEEQHKKDRDFLRASWKEGLKPLPIEEDEDDDERPVS